MRLTIAPGDSDVFSPLALVARLPAGAAPFCDVQLDHVEPERRWIGAEKSGQQGVWNQLNSVPTGSIGGYCGAIELHNLNTQRVTLDLAFVLVEAR